MLLKEKDIQWASEVFGKIDKKMKTTVGRNQGVIPYRLEDGKFENMAESNICWWTNGFWEGLLWILYNQTKDDAYKTTAEHCESLRMESYKDALRLHHDMGFLWHISSVLNYKITGNDESKVRGFLAATMLSSRFNIKGNYIKAWNQFEHKPANGITIIDSMMNLPLLYWASEVVEDNRFYNIAVAHANKTLNHYIRPDGSVKHIVVFDQETGEEIEEKGGQGYGVGTSWSRGQGWAIYGMALSYRYTKNVAYLEASKKVANYFIDSVKNDWLPRCDFRSPTEPVIYDASAGVIAANGFLELAKILPDEEGQIYSDAAIAILRAQEEKFCDWNEEQDGIMSYASINYHKPEGRNRYLVYTDFFFAEALAKVMGSDLVVW